MNSQRMTDSGDDSSAVIVHISKLSQHSQVPERERDGRGIEERFFKKNVQEDFIFL